MGTLYIGLDVHKVSISASVAEDGRDGAIRFLGEIPNSPTDVAKLAKRLAKDGDRLEFCYEAGCCGYGIHRQLTELGHGCMVVAPSLIPKKPGDRIKTDRRDSQKLAILHRSGDLTRVWVPDPVHEAMRDLVRARLAAMTALMRARQQLFAFLLRHGRTYEKGKPWTQRHRVWLAQQVFEQPVHQIVFQDYVEAIFTAQDRRDQLVARIMALVPSWSMGPLVEALRGLRGMEMVSAVTFVAGIGDLSRFDNPSQLMAYLGLVPSEHSSGDSVRRGGITKTGNSEARRMLVEAAWSYRYPPRVAGEKVEVLVRLPKPVRDIAWKALFSLRESATSPSGPKMLSQGDQVRHARANASGGGRVIATVRFDPMDSTDPETADFSSIDFDAATEIFVSIFPGASLAEVYERAVSAAANCAAMGFDHEARVLRETAVRIRRRLTH